MLSVTFLHQVCPNLSSELSAPLQTLPYAISECQWISESHTYGFQLLLMKPPLVSCLARHGD